jgi:hypothetical protein
MHFGVVAAAACRTLHLVATAPLPAAKTTQALPPRTAALREALVGPSEAHACLSTALLQLLKVAIALSGSRKCSGNATNAASEALQQYLTNAGAQDASVVAGCMERHAAQQRIGMSASEVR